MTIEDKDLDQLVDRLLEKYEARTRRDLPPLVIDIPKTAELLMRTVPAVQHLIKRGKLPLFKIDGKIQINYEDLRRIVRKNTEAPREEW